MKKFGLICSAVIGVMLLWVFYSKTTFDNFVLKGAVLFVIVTVVIPIATFYIRTKAQQKIYESNHPKSKKVEQSHIDLKEYQSLKEVYKRDREKYYLEARDLFKSLMQTRKMNRMDILEYKNMLNIFLGDYLSDFDGYTHTDKVNGREVTKKGFESDAHEIYVKMKSYHINEYEWKKLIGFLKNIADEKEEGTV